MLLLFYVCCSCPWFLGNERKIMNENKNMDWTHFIETWHRDPESGGCFRSFEKGCNITHTMVECNVEPVEPCCWLLAGVDCLMKSQVSTKHITCFQMRKQFSLVSVCLRNIFLRDIQFLGVYRRVWDLVCFGILFVCQPPPANHLMVVLTDALYLLPNLKQQVFCRSDLGRRHYIINEVEYDQYLIYYNTIYVIIDIDR